MKPTKNQGELEFALPNYLVRWVKGKYSSLPPGHRFFLYLKAWEGFSRPQGTEDRRGAGHRGAGDRRQPDGPRVTSSNKVDALQEVAGQTADNHVAKLTPALVQRQRALVAQLGDRAMELRASLKTPLTVGLGIEHPLEVGFSFLSPYGIPYLPGSSVKGALRAAAEDLVLFQPDSRGWSLSKVWYLFGFDENSGFYQGHPSHDLETVQELSKRWATAYEEALGREETALEAFRALLPSEAQRAGLSSRQLFLLMAGPSKESELLRREIRLRGALNFFDVYPEGSLAVDLMNPHYGGYYQKGAPPCDCGDPVPVPFLTIKENATFTFFVWFNPVPLSAKLDSSMRSLAAEVSQSWKDLVEAAFQRACAAGFGAKTAIGHGVLTREPAGPAGGGAQPPRTRPYAEVWRKVEAFQPSDLRNLGNLVNEIIQKVKEDDVKRDMARVLWEKGHGKEGKELRKRLKEGRLAPFLPKEGS